MSTYKFKVSDPSEIDIPRICRENADQDAFVIVFDNKIIYASKEELHLHRQKRVNCICAGLKPEYTVGDALQRITLVPEKEFCGFLFGWDATNEGSSVESLQTRFFKRAADARAEINRKKKPKQLVTVIAKD